jgi:DNA/RNA non-specific endonuclease
MLGCRPSLRGLPPMPPHRGSRLLVWLLAVAVVVSVLAGCEGLPQVPEVGPPSTARRSGETARQNVAEIRRLGGVVDYGRVDPKTGQRSGITATITPAMVRSASARQLGSAADSEIRPPGFGGLPARNRSRGHLLGRQLGGSGEVASNLVALYQRRANSPVMRDYETAVAEAVEHGETIRYRVRLTYPSPTFKGPPKAVRITATGNHGFRLDVLIDNTAEARVREYIPLPAGS